MKQLLSGIMTGTMLLAVPWVTVAAEPAAAPSQPAAVKSTKPAPAEVAAQHRQRDRAQQQARTAAAKKDTPAEPVAEEAIEAARAEKLKKRNKAARKNRQQQTGSTLPAGHPPVPAKP